MELANLFTDVKWDILKFLSERKSSPLEISNELNTTISNISQQLKLLEMAGLVKKEKIPNRDKGKPRTIYYLPINYSYLISIMDTFTEKKLLELTDHHKLILKIWFIDNPNFHYYVEKFYWKIEDKIDKIKAMAIRFNKNIEVIIISDKVKELKKKLGSVKIKNPKGDVEVFNCLVYDEGSIKRSPSLLDKFYIFYDPENIFSKLKKENESINSGYLNNKKTNNKKEVIV